MSPTVSKRPSSPCWWAGEGSLVPKAQGGMASNKINPALGRHAKPKGASGSRGPSQNPRCPQGLEEVGQRGSCPGDTQGYQQGQEQKRRGMQMEGGPAAMRGSTDPTGALGGSMPDSSRRWDGEPGAARDTTGPHTGSHACGLACTHSHSSHTLMQAHTRMRAHTHTQPLHSLSPRLTVPLALSWVDLPLLGQMLVL